MRTLKELCQEALENDLQSQFTLLEIPENEREDHEENFWFNSRIDKLKGDEK